MSARSSVAASSEDTKDRIIRAALETITHEGITGTSARAIARHGGFNQALIFYHFGSINDVLIETMRRSSEERLARYKERLADVHDLKQLATIAADLHKEDMDEGRITLLSQLLAGAAGHPELGPPLLEAFRPWMDVVQDSLKHAVGESALEELIPLDQVALAVTSMFLGIELLTHLGEDEGKSAALFDSFQRIADLLQALLGSDAAQEAAARPRQRLELSD